MKSQDQRSLARATLVGVLSLVVAAAWAAPPQFTGERMAPSPAPAAQATVPTIAQRVGWDVGTREGILLLEGGRILKGEISRSGERYVVTVPAGEIRVAAAEVRYFCQSMAEAFEYQRGLVNPADSAGRLALVNWCLRQGLFNEAEAEIAALAERGINAHRLDALRRQLDHQRAASGGPEDGPARSPRAHVVPASHMEMERALRDVPPRALEAFATDIEPLLLNTCLVGGCHGYRSEQEFRLQRGISRQGHSRRLTQRNLYAVLRQVNLDGADIPQLLQRAGEPHGGSTGQALSQPQRAQLAQWISWLREKPAGPLRVAAPTAAEGVLQSPVAAQALAGGKDSPDGSVPAAESAQLPEPTATDGVADPFDPEAFHRQTADGTDGR